MTSPFDADVGSQGKVPLYATADASAWSSAAAPASRARR